ncbi:hypothetical protein KI387_039677, partial [Taxus chinensis]
MVPKLSISHMQLIEQRPPIVRDRREVQPQPACLLQAGGERHYRDQQGEVLRA